MPSNELHFSAKAIDAIRRGRMVEAIKYVREDNRIGLREAKEAVAAYREGGSHAHGGAPTVPPDVHEGTDMHVTIDRLLRDGDTLQAIRLLREATGIDLGQAKAWVDARRDGSSAPVPAARHTTVQPASSSHASRHGPTVQRDTGGNAWMWLVLALLAVALAIWWFGG